MHGDVWKGKRKNDTIFQQLNMGKEGECHDENGMPMRRRQRQDE
jgi:hypothetical protein